MEIFFKKIATLEEVIQNQEFEFELAPTQQNRERLHKTQADLSRYLYMEEELWRQKAGKKWFKDGDRNSKFFHAYVTGRRKRLHLNRIQNAEGAWIEDQTELACEAVRFFQNQFSEDFS